MTEAETIAKPFELTAEQKNILTGLQHAFISDAQKIIEPLSNRVLQFCKDLEEQKFPKQQICFYVCECAEMIGVSDRHLRRLVPTEYKNEEQREVRLTHVHEGGHMSTSTIEPTTLEVNSEEDIEPIHEDPVSTSTHITAKKIGSYTQQLKSERDKAREELRSFRLRSGVTFVYECLMKEIPEPELGKKIKEYFLKDKWYLKWLKEENVFNVKGKTPEQAYLEHLEKTSDGQDEKEKQEAVKLAKKQAEKAKRVEPKDLSKVYKDKNKKKSKV